MSKTLETCKIFKVIPYTGTLDSYGILSTTSIKCNTFAGSTCKRTLQTRTGHQLRILYPTKQKTIHSKQIKRHMLKAACKRTQAIQNSMLSIIKSNALAGAEIPSISYLSTDFSLLTAWSGSQIQLLTFFICSCNKSKSRSH